MKSTPASSDLIEQSLEILRLSNDGESLDPFHLGLVEAAVNNNLTEIGIQTFQQLHSEVTAGKYAKPWLCGVESVTRDLQGYVYWKGIAIEHFTFSAIGPERLKPMTESLARKCLHLEELGLPITSGNYLNGWLDEMTVDFPAIYKELLSLAGTFYEHRDGRSIFPLKEHSVDGWPTEARFLEVHKGTIQERSLPLRQGDVPYHVITGVCGFQLGQCGQPQHTGPGAASLGQVMDWFQRHQISPSVAECLVTAMKK
jgi:hypothetical protein